MKHPGREPVAYGNFTPGFTASLAAALKGLRVLEVFAGNGLLASHLSELGVDVTATSVFSGHDGHELGMLFPVLPMDALSAVRLLGEHHDILLMSWPTVTEQATFAAMQWASQRDRPIFFIGEMPDPSIPGFGGLPGCATDLFFEATQEERPLQGYTARNMLDRAVELRAKPSYVAKWAASGGSPQFAEDNPFRP